MYFVVTCQTEVWVFRQAAHTFQWPQQFHGAPGLVIFLLSLNLVKSNKCKPLFGSEIEG
jgi:hypothetical protein